MTTDAVAAKSDVLGARVVAAIIDIVLMIALFIVFAMAFGESESSTSGEGASFSANLGTGATIIYLLVFVGYYFGMETAFGATVGKMVMGLRVVGLHGPATPGAIAMRTLLRVVDGLPALYLLGFIVAAVRSDRRRLGDLAAGTMVVSKGYVPVPAEPTATAG